MNQAHLDLLKQGAATWNNQRPWIKSLSGDELQMSYQRYLDTIRKIEDKWFDNMPLTPESIEEYQEALQENAANLAGADLQDRDLRGYDLSWCNLEKANLDRADLRDSNLVHANLTEAHLIGADLRGANLKKAHLDRASMYGMLVEQESLDAAGVQISDYQEQSMTGPFTGLPSLSLDAWGATVQFYQKRCAYCGGPYEVLDHFLPLSQGGTTSVGNVLPACFVCANARKNLSSRKVIPVEVIERLAADLKSFLPEENSEF